MPLIALKPLSVNGHSISTCEPVPEAEDWPNLGRLLGAGYLGFVEDEKLADFAGQLYAGQIPKSLAPSIPPLFLLAAMRRVRGLPVPKALAKKHTKEG